ncbi:hypothetical protein KRP22_001792 [Phytophthora ramorum]|nr:Sodium channel protein 60E [Phytophthora ramorum]
MPSNGIAPAQTADTAIEPQNLAASETKDARRQRTRSILRRFGADVSFFGCFPRKHWLRRRLILLVTHHYFDRFIVFAILLNSIILALSDFSVVDKSLNPASSGFAFRNGVVVPATSRANRLVNFSEMPFTSIFTAECLLKILATGFIHRKGSYMRDPWNVLDFVVVISSLVAILPTVPNVSVIRTIRVLRPLRSLSMIPGMRLLISALLKALPALGNVVVLQVFLFFMFSILGNQLFGGNMTRRCRLTEFPVLLPVDQLNPHGMWPVPDDYLTAVIANPEAYRCLDGPLLEIDSDGYVKETSPWNKARPCFWPTDPNDMQICARPNYSGNHQCIPEDTCGGNYDVYGNPRFLNNIVMEDALFQDALDYGFTTFDDIGHSLVTFFQVITSEGWTNIMYMCMDSTQPYVAILFYMAFIIFDSIIVMNLTLAVIADEFNIDEGTTHSTTEEKKMIKATEESSCVKPRVSWLYQLASHPLFSAFIMVVILANTVVLSSDHYPMSSATELNLEIINFALSCVFVAEMVIKILGLGFKLYARDRFNLFDAFVVIMGLLEMILSPPSFMSENQPKKRAVSSLRSFRLFRVFKLARNWRSLRELLEMIGRAIAGIANFGVLFFIFIYIYALIGMQFFGNTMRFDDNGYPTPYNINEYWFGTVPRLNFDTFLWSSITVFKIITSDNWNENIGWNVLDCVIVISSLVMLAESSSRRHSLKSLRSLRTFRAFRPLRVISRRPGLKLVVNALIEAIPAVFNVLIVCALFYLVFSIFAVNYLKGKLNSCTGNAFDALSDDQVQFLVNPDPWSSLSLEQQQWFTNTTCAGFPTDALTSKYLCGCWGADWGPVIPENFNNVGTAMISFFEISTTENWCLLMVACIDATDVDMQPIRDNNMGWAAFFVVFMMFGSFFVVNLFVGVIIENFNKMQDALGGSFMLTSEQKKWLKAQKTASHVGPQLILKPFKNPVRRAIFFFVRCKKFEWFIMICIIVNTLLMATQHFGQPTLQTTILAILNDIFAAIFTIEAALKLVAYGFTYFRDTWNQFDFFVVVGTLVSIVLESLTTTHLRSLAILARVFRVTRIIRLVKSFKGIRHILITLYLAMPGLSNATSILVLMLFIYTTMGVQMFAKVALSDNIDAHANFQSFGRGFLLMIRAATGESWDYCMHDFAGTTQGCVDDPPYDPTMCGFNNSDDCIPLNGCGNPIAYLFFCSFTLLGTYVMLNVTVAVILESFSVSNEDEEPLFDPEVLSEFQIKWAEVDPQAKGYIPVAKLHAICTILEEPLVSSDALRDKRSFLKFVTGLGLPMYEGETVYFTDTLLAMTREMVKAGVQDELNAIGSVTPSMEDMRSRQRLHYQAHDYFAARQIQRSVSGWLRCKRQLEKEYMEEYKSKIKKPSVRPKKQRGALVVTTG